MNLDIGTTLGDYQIIGVLGAGGMGKVYKVRNVISDRVEAMKVLLPNLDDNQELAERFLREIKVQASLDHPNIAGLHTAQRVGNQLLMIMEFVEGATIESIMRQGRIPLRDGVNYVSQVLSALSYAHARDIVHRDIKPANMMLTDNGIVKLMDFGIAKLTADRHLTKTGHTLGSLFYMSPEQIRGDSTIDGRADLYALGVSLYEIATGKRPFEADSDYSLMAAHLQQNPVPPVQVDPTLPAGLNEIILISIAKDPAQRFQTADAFKAALGSVEKDLPVAAGVAGGPSGTKLFTPPPAPTVTVAAPAQAAAAAMPAPPLPQAAPPPTSSSSSHRGLYMVLGSVVAIAVLVAAGLEIPKWWKARASGEPQTPVTQTQPATQQPTAQQPPVQQTPAAPSPAQVEQPAPAAVPPQQQQPVEQPAPRGIRTVPAQPVPNVKRPPPAVQQQQPPSAPPVVAQQPPQQLEQAKPVQTPSGPDPAVVKQLDELRHRQTLMAVRAGAIKGSLDRLQQEQARAGLGISSDLVATNQRMAYYMDLAEAAIRDGKPDVAQKHLDNAERELSKLEDRFGR